MLLELKDYLALAAPHLSSIMEDANNVFDLADLPDHDDRYMNCLMMSESNMTDDSATLDAIISITTELGSNFLQDHGIKLLDYTSIPTITQLMRAILQIPQYEDQMQVYQLTTQPEDSLTVLSELIELVSGMDAHSVQTTLDEVSPWLITRIREESERQLNHTEDLDDIMESMSLEPFNAYIAFVDGQYLAIKQLLDGGLLPNHKYAIYEKLLLDHSKDAHIRPIVDNLIAASLISVDVKDNPIPAVKSSLEKFIPNLEDVTKALVLVTSRLLEFNKLRTNGTKEIQSHG